MRLLFRGKKNKKNKQYNYQIKILKRTSVPSPPLQISEYINMQIVFVNLTAGHKMHVHQVVTYTCVF